MAPDPLFEPSFAEVDERLIERFERAWLADRPLAIRDCLPAESDPTYLGTLEELVHIDREFRWKGQEGPAASRPSLIPLESYLGEYPRLEAVRLGLIQGEFELAHRFGPPPSVEEYVERFGEEVSGRSLRAQLESLRKETRPVHRLQPGTLLGRYEIVNQQGRGGFGAVWRARDTKLGRRIAVKQLGQQLARDAESRRRFISEGRVTARLEHPGIVPIYDISNAQEDFAYYTMRLIQGRTMAEAIDELHRLPSNSNEFHLRRRRLLQSFIDTCRTIEYAHSRGVIHRDLKPHNIIVGDYGETILLDWGLASVLDGPAAGEASESIADDPEVLTPQESMQTLRAGHAVGTPAYMPPEQARGELDRMSYRSDVYSLGATLYHLLTGSVPFSEGPLEGLLERVKSGQLSPAHERNPAVERPLSAIAARALAPEIDKRYAEVADLVGDVQRFLADQPVSAYRDPWHARLARWIRKHPTATAASALTAVFVLLVAGAAASVANAWRAREEKRIAGLRIAVERADATALSQIKSGRFDAAVRTLAQGRALIAGERGLAALAQQLTARETRTRRILDFYRFGTRAQEETFLDRTNLAAMYCQAAVHQLAIFEHADWWEALPDDDLSPLQREQLRSEAYRVITLLASMRFAETARGTMSLDVLTSPQRIAADDPAARSIQAARLAAAVANRYRPSRAMQLIIDIADYSRGAGESVSLRNLHPLNATDSAVMGSILDNNVPAEGPVRDALSMLLDLRNPNEVAKQWLNDAVNDSPDWYWLPVFVGHSQIRVGQPEAGIPSLSHAVGLRPDYWVGYQYRALASIAAAAQQPSRARKTELLNAASRDLQRALDLEPHNSELYWVQALLRFQEGAHDDPICESFLTALALHPPLGDIRGGHYSGVSQGFFAEAQEFVAARRAAGTMNAALTQLELAAALWQHDVERARAAAADARKNFPDDPDVQALVRCTQLLADPESAQPMAATPASRWTWHVAIADAEWLARHQRWDDAARMLEGARDQAQASWQRSKTLVALARCQVAAGDAAAAAESVRQLHEFDLAADLTPVAAAAEEAGAASLVELCSQIRAQTDPVTQIAEAADTWISRPALRNGDFELGLSYAWAPYTRRTTATSWNNLGQSRTAAEAVATHARTGRRSLRLRLDSPNEAGSYGWMTQEVPVTGGQRYVLRFWARAQSLESEALVVGVAGEPQGEFVERLAVAGGSYDWREYQLEFQAGGDEATIAIRASGSGEVWLDDLQLQATAPAAR